MEGCTWSGILRWGARVDAEELGGKQANDRDMGSL